MKYILNFIGMASLIMIPILFIAKIWGVGEVANKLLFSDITLLISSIVGYYIFFYDKK